MAFWTATLCYSVFALSLTGAFEIEANLNYDPPKVKYYMQRLDHFNPLISARFKQKYLISTQYWGGDEAPIFFYTGNEGNIETFSENTGFMWDIAPKFGAMVVFAEHRFYGSSSPYSGVTPSPATINKFGQFTADQALADYAELIQYLKSMYKADHSKVIAFGGSYGGMLAAWFRMKYPNIVDGSIAASAPVAMFPSIIDCDAFNKAITESFADTPNGSQCVETIRHSYSSITNVARQEGGLQYISETFNLCSQLHNISDVDQLHNWMESGWGNVAMGNYPYPTSFLNPMPAWPVRVVCSKLAQKPFDDKEALTYLSNAAQIFFNYTGDVKCLDINGEIVPALSGYFWFLQTCTQFPMPFCANGVSDMFRPVNWTVAGFTKTCQQTFGTTPQPEWPVVDFGGKDIRAASNIVFSNGNLDPWKVGGISKALSDKVYTILIKQGAHHLDLRHSNPEDPKSVIEARKLEVAAISKWLAEH